MLKYFVTVLLFPTTIYCMDYYARRLTAQECNTKQIQLIIAKLAKENVKKMINPTLRVFIKSNKPITRRLTEQEINNGTFESVFKIEQGDNWATFAIDVVVIQTQNKTKKQHKCSAS